MEHTQLKEHTGKVFLALIAGFIFLASIIAFAVYADDQTEDQVFGSIWLIIGLIQMIIYLRTGNRALIAWMTSCLLIACSYFSDYKGVYFWGPVVLLLSVDIYFKASRRLTWKYKDILQLAAKDIHEASNGFTSRSMPLNMISLAPTDLKSFGKFMANHLIAFPFHNKSGTYFCINTSGATWFSKPRQERDTYILFHHDGPVEVNIARKEYDQYKEELTFDLLCQSLGDLFVQFFELFCNGKSQQILNIVNRGVKRGV